MKLNIRNESFNKYKYIGWTFCPLKTPASQRQLALQQADRRSEEAVWILARSVKNQHKPAPSLLLIDSSTLLIHPRRLKVLGHLL